MPDPLSTLNARSRWLEARRQRALVVIAGPRDWTLAQALARVPEGSPRALWVGEHCPVAGVTACRGDQAHQWLGRELDLVVWDSHSGTHPGGLAAISGALVGGGILLWLVPPLQDWSWQGDPDYRRMRRHQPPYYFLERLARLLGQVSFPHALITPDQPHLEDTDPPASAAAAPNGPTADQQHAMAAIEAMADVSHPRPLVLRADRGRGKSAVLGMAAARLASAGALRIAVTAPRPSALESFWRFAGDAKDIVYLPPDELIRRPCDWDLLLVDEAAALPVPVLLTLLDKSPRAVFATTVHGYEGSGRGFDLRFRAFLDERTPGWQLLKLNEPVRWAPGDPLEALMSDLLCLDADPAENPRGACSDVVIERLEPELLSRDEPLLRQVVGLLVSAHYQTSPDDLRQLLDDPDSILWIARGEGQVIGVNWLLLEGGLDSELAEAVWLGRRRPRGHLMAQSLAFHGGDPEAARCHYARITRIAVHPQWRRRGLASRMIATARARLAGMATDVLGVSFGVTADLMPFWSGQGFVLLRLGLRRDPASGTHAVMLGLPLTARGTELCQDQARRFAAHWPMLRREFDAMPTGLVAQLEAMMERPESMGGDEALTEADFRELEAFSRGHRGLELTRLPLQRLASQAPVEWPEADRRLWDLAVGQGVALTELRASGLIQGQRDGLSRLRRMSADFLAGQRATGM